MKNLYLLSTEKPCYHRYLVFNKEGKLSLWNTDTMGNQKTLFRQHIYIVENSEIKEEDIDKYTCIFKSSNGLITALAGKGHGRVKTIGSYFKIIITTNEDLIADGVQAITYDFLDWFVKNPSCDKIEFEIDLHDSQLGNGYCFDRIFYKIILPKEEPRKLTPESFIQDIATHLGKTIPETLDHLEKFAEDLDKLKEKQKEEKQKLEEFIKSYVNRIDRSEEGLVEKCLIDGAKWQAKRMYSEHEVLTIVRDSRYSEFAIDDLDIWFDQFKKNKK